MMTLAPIFTDHAVLQREKPVCIFGTCTDGAVITLTMGDIACKSNPAADGRWEIILPPLPAGGPYTLSVTDGQESLTISDIMVGEVWLCGGQSNMELNLKDANGAQDALNSCENSNVRLYHVCKRGFFDEQFYREEADSCWNLPSVHTCPYWSAVGYYFARELAQKLGVTVGLVNCNYGGTSASAWMSREMLAETAVGRLYLEDYEKGTEGLTDEEADRAYDAYMDYHVRWNEKVAQCYAQDPAMKWAKVLEICGENLYPGPHAPKNPLRPHGLYDTMVRRIIPYTLRGVLYYQGESDDHRPDGYALLLTSLIRQWRRDFRDEQLPFLMVQLPIYGVEDTPDYMHWCRIREAQEEVYRSVRNTGLAVILECGEWNEIHPKEKEIPAHRLYLQALHHVYDLQHENTCAPMFDYALPENGGMRLFFRHAQCGLEARGSSGFELCGTDGIWHEAQAQINEDTIFVRSKDVPHPVAARYCWRNYTEVTVFARNGLPLAPLRTDKRY